MTYEKAFSRSGTFQVEADRSVYGELYLAGKDTAVYLRDEKFFHLQRKDCECIYGRLFDLTKVTLIDCLVTHGVGTTSRMKEQYHHEQLFPHYVVLGDRHVSADEAIVRFIAFEIDDATSLFYDFDAFGKVLDARPFIAELVKANKPDREIPIGDDPQIAYFTGKHQIVSTETVLGTIVAQHNPGWSFGGPEGVHISNRISVTITPPAPITFHESTDHMRQLLRFFELVVGRTQVVNGTWINVVTDDELAGSLQVHESHQHVRIGRPKGKDRSPQPYDMLLIPADMPEAYSTVLSRWLARDDEWRDSRLRLSSWFGNDSVYSIERLVGTANMFDILPKSAVPKRAPLTYQLAAAGEECKRIFRALPPSAERGSVLGELGRLGKNSLRLKVRHRAQMVIERAPDRFEELLDVVDEAVSCRNHYVHGSQSKINYGENSGVVSFFIDTLEFVFAASDFIECGWDINEWLKRGSTGTHPFGRYKDNYGFRIDLFRKALQKSHKTA